MDFAEASTNGAPIGQVVDILDWFLATLKEGMKSGSRREHGFRWCFDNLETFKFSLGSVTFMEFMDWEALNFQRFNCTRSQGPLKASSLGLPSCLTVFIPIKYQHHATFLQLGEPL
jgi:hypothetical protein